MRLLMYVGIAHTGTREVFKCSVIPTEKGVGDLYAAVIGPFKTLRGARFMRDQGGRNPHVQCVADAERIAKEIENDNVGSK